MVYWDGSTIKNPTAMLWGRRYGLSGLACRELLRYLLARYFYTKGEDEVQYLVTNKFPLNLSHSSNF